jgi:hypothetical protein
MSGLSTIEGVSSKMKGPEKLLWYAASAAKAKSRRAASVFPSPSRSLDESAFFPREVGRARVLLFIPLKGLASLARGPRPLTIPAAADLLHVRDAPRTDSLSVVRSADPPRLIGDPPRGAPDSIFVHLPGSAPPRTSCASATHHGEARRATNPADYGRALCTTTVSSPLAGRQGVSLL